MFWRALPSSTLRGPVLSRFKSTFAVSVHLEGVLDGTKKSIPGAKKVLKKFQERSIPFVFMAGDDRITEAMQAERLTERLGMEVSADQVILSSKPQEVLEKQAAALGFNDGVHKIYAVGDNPDSDIVECVRFIFGAELEAEVAAEEARREAARKASEEARQEEEAAAAEEEEEMREASA